MRTFSILALAAGIASAAVAPDVAAKLVAIGRGVCVPETAAIYGPMHGKPPYKDVTITRDISFGADPKNVLDVAEAEKGGGSRPVLIYVSGGAGNKQQGGPNGEPFYDNIMLWAVKNGMTGVNMQRRGGPGLAWDDPAKDVGLVIEWVHKNIASHKGDPNRVFIWSQSAGNIPVSTYLGHPELYGPSGIGVKGAVFMSAPAFNILPVTPQPIQVGIAGCGNPAGAPAAAGRGRGPGGPPAVDPATQLARSNLPGLLNAKISIFLAAAELDPPGMAEFNETLKEQLCKAGHCPTAMVFKDHSHISEVMSPNTDDDSVTGPILKWMKSVK